MVFLGFREELMKGWKLFFFFGKVLSKSSLTILGKYVKV